MRRSSSKLLGLLLGLLLGWGTSASEARARSLPPVQALEALPAQTASQQLTERLKSGHARTDAALKLRRERFDTWQQAVLARDEAAATVERMKRAGQRGEPLEASLRRALVLDEQANLARSALMAAEAEVARSGAELLRVYDALLTLKRREADAFPARDPRREAALSTWQALAQQRDKVRRSLGPVLRAREPIDGGTDVSVEAHPDDDVETLLEKADLARDLEERFLRRAEAVERRIQELLEERAVARDVAGLVQSQSLFDEDDMRLRVLSPEVRGNPSLPRALPGGPVASETSGGRGGEVVGDTPTTEAPGGRAPADGTPMPPPLEPDVGGAPGADFSDGALAGGTEEAPAPSLGADVTGTLASRAAERAFSLQATDVDVDAMLSSGELSLPELRALQRKLRQRAAEMRAQSKELREQVKERGAR